MGDELGRLLREEEAMDRNLRHLRDGKGVMSVVDCLLRDGKVGGITEAMEREIGMGVRGEMLEVRSPVCVRIWA